MQGSGLIIAVASMLIALGSGRCTFPRQPEAQPPAPAQGQIKTADDLLDALETADKDLVSLTAQVKFDRTFEIQGDRQTRIGKLWFLTDKPAEAGAGGGDRKSVV